MATTKKKADFDRYDLEAFVAACLLDHQLIKLGNAYVAAKGKKAAKLSAEAKDALVDVRSRAITVAKGLKLEYNDAFLPWLANQDGKGLSDADLAGFLDTLQGADGSLNPSGTGV